ncbi:tRNA (adenosine(37)-N6)-threonylcarbamoyltransferase complex dimerization subunit type 1 TsaB [Candidatus Saccharibacteria bacterium]|nr:tRNA (adenosine(37)-N6)-threonylcarbamoyltransferase complex dimerization subunit type 1 TsaB [Candidatus Saccharibacteria bacterium]
MIILTIRTDREVAEVGVYDSQNQLAYDSWQAHRALSTTLNKKILEILNKLSISREEVQGIVVFKGPGSFTGLRIGMTVANALAYGLNLPIVSHGGEQWLTQGVKALEAGENEKIALPEYGSPAKTTAPRS